VITVKSSEWQGVDGMGEEMLRDLKPKAEPLMWDAGTKFQAELKRTLSGSRSGIPYPASKRGPAHVASAAGEPPAVWTGNLRNSMGFTRPRWKGWTLEMEVGSGLGVGKVLDDTEEKNPSYARRLEYGGISFHPWPVKISARPYMRPTALKMDPVIQKMCEARL
jgi:hypothetical protein